MFLLRFPGLLTAVALLLFAPTATRAQEIVETYADTVPLARDGAVTIDNHEGAVTVTTWDRAKVKYEARVTAEDGADHPERTTVSVNRSGGRLDLQTEYDESDDDGGFFGWNSQNTMPVYYTVKMPESGHLTIDDHESNIEVTGLRGALSVDTHEGPITIAHQRGEVVIDAHESRIRLSDLASKLELDTHEGRVTGTNLRGGVEMETHESDVDFTFASLGEGVDIDTHEGSFTLTLPSEAGFDLDTDFDDDARLHSSFDLSALRITDGDDDDEVNYRGSVNGGGPPLRLSSHEGRFRLRSR